MRIDITLIGKNEERLYFVEGQYRTAPPRGTCVSQFPSTPVNHSLKI